MFYILSRARADGHLLQRLPAFATSHVHVYAYMVAKYTLRWQFYRTASWAAGKRSHARTAREVVNPRKDIKVREVASRHGIDPERFTLVCRRLRWVWPLLP